MSSCSSGTALAHEAVVCESVLTAPRQRYTNYTVSYCSAGAMAYPGSDSRFASTSLLTRHGALSLSSLTSSCGAAVKAVAAHSGMLCPPATGTCLSFTCISRRVRSLRTSISQVHARSAYRYRTPQRLIMRSSSRSSRRRCCHICGCYRARHSAPPRLSYLRRVRRCVSRHTEPGDNLMVSLMAAYSELVATDRRPPQHAEGKPSTGIALVFESSTAHRLRLTLVAGRYLLAFAEQQ